MNKLLIFGVAVLFSSTALAQSTISSKQKPLSIVEFSENVNAPLSSKERSYIVEVYGDYAEQYVFSNPNRLKDIKNILRNRVILNEYPRKDLSSFPKLSSVPLLKAFNSNVSRDASINASNFNPLKYQFNFFSRESQIKYYWVDNTQLLISILPQHN
jgi:hypothetical protein